MSYLQELIQKASDANWAVMMECRNIYIKNLPKEVISAFKYPTDCYFRKEVNIIVSYEGFKTSKINYEYKLPDHLALPVPIRHIEPIKFDANDDKNKKLKDLMNSMVHAIGRVRDDAREL